MKFAIIVLIALVGCVTAAVPDSATQGPNPQDIATPEPEYIDIDLPEPPRPAAPAAPRAPLPAPRAQISAPRAPIPFAPRFPMPRFNAIRPAEPVPAHSYGPNGYHYKRPVFYRRIYRYRY